MAFFFLVRREDIIKNGTPQKWLKKPFFFILIGGERLCRGLRKHLFKCIEDFSYSVIHNQILKILGINLL